VCITARVPWLWNPAGIVCPHHNWPHSWLIPALTIFTRYCSLMAQRSLVSILIRTVLTATDGPHSYALVVPGRGQVARRVILCDGRYEMK
jgi:hypothetical protein